MKKRLVVVLAVGLALAGCGGGNGAVTTPSTNALMQPDVYYELDTWGSNSEMYEFTPRTAPEKTCIVFLTDGKHRPAMQCFDKSSFDNKVDKKD